MDENIKIEIVRGISDTMVSRFALSAFFSEAELYLEGVVGDYIEGNYDIERYRMVEYVKTRAEDYMDYCQTITGSSPRILTDKPTLHAYIVDREIEQEYVDFVKSNEWRMSMEERREKIYDDKIAPVLLELQSNDIYIYRDRDHYALRILR